MQGQDLSNLSFAQACDKLKKYISAADFDRAEALLPLLDSLAKNQRTPETEADLRFYKGYFWLFKSGDINSYQQLLDAAKAYGKLGLKPKQHLAEALLCVNLYHLAREEECLAESEKLLATIPLEEEEARGLIHNIVGAIYAGDNGDPEKAIAHCKQAIPYFEKNKDYRRLVSLNGILAASSNALKRYPQALAYINNAGDFAQKAKNQQQVAFLKIRKGRTLFFLNKMEEALTSYYEAKDYFEEHGSKHGELTWVNSNIRELYLKKGDYKMAYEFHLVNDSLGRLARTRENDKAINDLMVQYETEKKEQQIQVQALRIENEQQRNQQLLSSAIGGLALLSLLFILGYFYYRNQQQQELREQQLQYQEQLLAATVNTQEAERKRIARDLHDGIGQQLSGLKMGFQVLVEKLSSKVPDQEPQFAKLGAIIHEASTDVRELSHQMMPKALASFGLVPAMSDMLDKSLGSANLVYQFEHVGFKQRLPENIEIGVYRIAQELINNILKHSNAKEVEIQLMHTKKQLLLIVEDDGQGFDPGSVKNEGHGLTNIRSRLQAIRGEVNFDCPQKGGTIATIRVGLS